MPGGAPLEKLATLFFALAVLHVFAAGRIRAWACRYPEGSIAENFLHLLGEVEVVFGLWAGALVLALSALEGFGNAVAYVESLSFTEPLFVFAIMAVAATRPVTESASWVIERIARKGEASFVFAALVVGPCLGSLITEPAAMTVTALVLKARLFDRKVSDRLRYAALGTLFVNVSIGGVFTHFSAPPVLMVADLWGWTTPHMAANFGWKALIATVLSSLGLVLAFRGELASLKSAPGRARRAPLWIAAAHLAALALIAASSHHPAIFLAALVFFLGFAKATREYQAPLRLQESLLVGFFLAGLVVLGGPQRWWLEPLLTKLGAGSLFLGATALTSITDNAALTYLGAQVPGLADSLKYALVAGAVAGGGMTVIANAPNPAGFGILQDSFGRDGISSLRLALGALAPTLVAMACLWWL